MDYTKKLIKKTNLNIFTIITDPDCDMHEVRLNGKDIYMGNTWDFHPGCYGEYHLGDFSGPESYVNAVIVHYKIAKHKIVGKTMRYTGSGKWKKI